MSWAPRAAGTVSKGFQHLHPGIFRDLGLSPVHSHPWCPNSQEEVVVPTAPALQGLGEVVSLSLPCPVSLRAVTLLSAAPGSDVCGFLSCWGSHFPLFCYLCKRETSVHTSLKNGHQLLYGPLPPKVFNLHWSNWFSKRENKNRLNPKVNPKIIEASSLWNCLLSVLRAWGISEWIFFTSCFPAVECELQAGDSSSQKGGTNSCCIKRVAGDCDADLKEGPISTFWFSKYISQNFKEGREARWDFGGGLFVCLFTSLL